MNPTPKATFPNEFNLFTDDPTDADNKVLINSYSRATKTINWNLEKECWVSGREPNIASPSLRNCYSTTDQACCNYIEDDSVGGQFTSFIPSPCQGDHPEISNFMCFSCNGDSYQYVIKAEPTKNYVEAIKEMMTIQYKQTSIDRSLITDIRSSKPPYPNGYIKVCASWARTMWAGKLSAPTEMFDNCGVYDGSGAVPKPSQEEKWNTALKFLEWYKVPLMEGFGIILIDDENQDQYSKLANLGYTTDCFKHGVKLLVSKFALSLVILYSIGM